MMRLIPGVSENNVPAFDPALNDTLAGTLQFVVGKMIQNTNGMLPAQVIAYDRTANRVQVQILISMLTSSGAQVPRSQVASIPVLSLGGGGYLLNFPLNTGDLGWILASDRDISLFLQSYSQAAPNTARTFSFSDGLFIPDIMKGYTIATEDAEHAVLQNLDGTVRISLWPAQVKITAPVVTIEGNLAVTGGLTMSGGGYDIRKY